MRRKISTNKNPDPRTAANAGVKILPLFSHITAAVNKPNQSASRTTIWKGEKRGLENRRFRKATAGRAVPAPAQTRQKKNNHRGQRVGWVRVINTQIPPQPTDVRITAEGIKNETGRGLRVSFITLILTHNLAGQSRKPSHQGAFSKIPLIFPQPAVSWMPDHNPDFSSAFRVSIFIAIPSQIH
jgi:hypothetical protein